MNRLALIAIGAGALGAVAAGCGSSASGGGMASPATGTNTTVVKTASTPVGKVLVDANGRTLYLFKSDTGTTPTCTGSCAATWPAATATAGTPQASGVNAAMLGTTTNAGHKQVTFDGHPLYYYSGDQAMGQVNGQGLHHLWYTVSPTGAADTSAPTSSGGSGGSGGSSGGYGY